MAVNVEWGARVCAMDEFGLHFINTVTISGRVSLFAFRRGTVIIVKGTGTTIDTCVTAWTVVETLNLLCLALVDARFVGTGFGTCQIDHFTIMATYFCRVLTGALLAITWEREENKRIRTHPLADN